MGNKMKFAALLTILAMAFSGSARAQSWDTLGLEGLDVTDISLNSSAPESVFAINTSKVFKSTDGGASFSPVFINPVGGRLMTAIEVSPSDPAAIVVSDEGNVFGNGAKFFRSTDGGRNWVEVPTALPKEIDAIAVDPVDSGIAFFATQDGLYRLTEQKDTLTTLDVAIDPNDVNIMYEGFRSGNGIGKSTDAGETWPLRLTSGFNSATSFVVDNIAVNPLNSMNLFVTANYFTARVIVYEMYESINGGENWTPLPWPDDVSQNALGIDASQGYLFVGHLGGITIRGLAGGSFLPLTGDLSVGRVNAVAIDQGQRVLVGTTQGVFGLDYYPDLSGAYMVVDEPSGDGVPDPGETVNLAVGLVNRLFDGSDISATLSVINDPTVTVTDGAGTYPDIPANSAGDNGADPFVIEIDQGASSHSVSFQLDISASGGAVTSTDTVSLMIGMPTVMLVDDDGGAAYDTFYTNTMDSLAFPFDVWDMSVMGSITDQLQWPTHYHTVIWMSGSEMGDVMTDADVAVLTDYMNGGGRLILSGQNIVEDLDNGGSPDPFLTDILHISLEDSSAIGRLLFGVPGDVLGDQIEKALISGGGGANNQTSPDIFATPDSVAVPFVTYVAPSGAVGGVHVENTDTGSEAIVLGFGFESVNRSNPADSTMITRGELMNLMLGFFTPVGIGDDGSPGEIGIPKAFALGQNYPNPFNPSTTIRYTVPEDQSQAEHVVMKIYNVRGQLITTLVNDDRESGDYVVQWNGRADSGEKVGSGIYIYRISIGGHTAARKMVLVK